MTPLLVVSELSKRFAISVAPSFHGLKRRFAGGAQKQPQVHAVLCGHIHRAMSAGWQGTHVVVCPSTAHTLHLELAPESDIHYRLEPPAFCVHRWDGNVLVTHVVQGGSYAGPYQYT